MGSSPPSKPKSAQRPIVAQKQQPQQQKRRVVRVQVAQRGQQPHQQPNGNTPGFVLMKPPSSHVPLVPMVVHCPPSMLQHHVLPQGVPVRYVYIVPHQSQPMNPQYFPQPSYVVVNPQFATPYHYQPAIAHPQPSQPAIAPPQPSQPVKLTPAQPSQAVHFQPAQQLFIRPVPEEKKEEKIQAQSDDSDSCSDCDSDCSCSSCDCSDMETDSEDEIIKVPDTPSIPQPSVTQEMEDYLFALQLSEIPEEEEKPQKEPVVPEKYDVEPDEIVKLYQEGQPIVEDYVDVFIALHPHEMEHLQTLLNDAVTSRSISFNVEEYLLQKAKEESQPRVVEELFDINYLSYESEDLEDDFEYDD